MAALLLPAGADARLMSDLDSLGPVSRSGNPLLEQFGIEVPEEDLEGVETVGHAFDLVTSKL